MLIENLILLLGGLLTWTAVWLLRKKNAWGWAINWLAIVCYTVAPVRAGLWMALIVNIVTFVLNIMAFLQWRKNGA